MTNEINYKDFEPQVLEKKFWSGSSYESTQMVLERVNEWIRKNYNMKIINVETLLVPTMNYTKKKTNAKKLNMGGGYVYMIEVVRVWYQ
ncbi:MAG: hypothetical protein ACSHWW_09630 [Nonlabens sp.]|uniref:hypothetical protein n=1 Tax=Nonlabens sp. TaxID=1888209 RepID=UPI003EFB16A1